MLTKLFSLEAAFKLKVAILAPLSPHIFKFVPGTSPFQVWDKSDCMCMSFSLGNINSLIAVRKPQCWLNFQKDEMRSILIHSTQECWEMEQPPSPTSRISKIWNSVRGRNCKHSIFVTKLRKRFGKPFSLFFGYSPSKVKKCFHKFVIHLFNDRKRLVCFDPKNKY